MSANYRLLTSILLMSITLFFAMPVLALSDDFSNYSRGYLILDDTPTSGWTPGYDTTGIVSSSVLKNDGSSFVAQVNTLYSVGENRASVHKTISTKNILRFMQVNGKLNMWYLPTDVSGITSLKIRIGTNSSNYFEYTNSLPFGVNFIPGAQLVTFDLANPSSTVGSPQANAISYIQVTTNYTGAQPNFDFTINRIWVERSNTAFQSHWVVPFFGGRPDGWALPYSNVNEGTGMSLTNTDIPSLGQHGRIYYRTEPTSNDQSFTVESDVRIINAQWGARLFFDFMDGFNFSSVYLTNQYNKVGVESYVNNVRTYSQIPFTIVSGQTYRVRYVVNGAHVSVFVDNVHMLDWDVPSRRAGELGLESFRGTTHFSHFTYT